MDLHLSIQTIPILNPKLGDYKIKTQEAIGYHDDHDGAFAEFHHADVVAEPSPFILTQQTWKWSSFFTWPWVTFVIGARIILDIYGQNWDDKIERVIHPWLDIADTISFCSIKIGTVSENIENLLPEVVILPEEYKRT